jgi:ATP-dependent Clp protease protease subunit
MTGFSLSDQPQAALFARRIVTVTGPLDARTAGDTAAALLTLDALADEPVELRLDCPSAGLGPAFTVMDVIDVIGVRVVVHCAATAGQGAAGVLAVGTRRTIGVHGRVHLAEPPQRFSGRAGDIGAAVHQHAAELARFHDRLARATGHPRERLETDMAAGRMLDAAAALAYGLVDEIVGRPRPAPGPDQGSAR